MRNGYGTSTWGSATEDPQKLAEDIALVVLEPREPADEEEWAAFLDQFGEAKWRPDGELGIEGRRSSGLQRLALTL